MGKARILFYNKTNKRLEIKCEQNLEYESVQYLEPNSRSCVFWRSIKEYSDSATIYTIKVDGNIVLTGNIYFTGRDIHKTVYRNVEEYYLRNEEAY